MPEDELPGTNNARIVAGHRRGRVSRAVKNRTTRVGGLHPGSGSGARFGVSNGT